MEAQKNLLRGIVTATPTAITIQELAREYRNTIGEPIPYGKLGYNSLEHFLHSMPDTIQIQGYGPLALVNPVVSTKSSHVMELVSKQKIEVRRGKKFGYRMPPPMKRHVVVTTDFLNKSVPSRRPQPQKMYYPPANNKTTLSSQPTSISNITKPSSDYQVTDNSYSLCGSSSENKNTGNLISCKNTVIEKIPVRHNTTDYDLEVKQITKAIEKTSLLDANKLRNSHKTPEKNHEIPNSDSIASDLNKTPMEDSEESVPVIVKNNLKKLISQYPNGIWCAEIPNVYRKMFRRTLAFQDLGFRNLIDLCMCLKSIFHYVRPSKEDFKLYDRSRPIPVSDEKYFTASGALPSLDWSDVDSFLPPNVFKPGNEIPRTFVPDDTKENDTIDIVVGEIFDVSKFWVYRDDGKLDKLMDDIQLFYKENAGEYKLPLSLIKEGVYCVAIIIGEYHRALIIDSRCPSDDSTRVFFIDYGTMAKIKSELFYLHEQFAELPAQTIRCRLSNICPPEKGAPWSQESSKEFRRIIKKRDLTAKISRVDWKDQYLEVFLADVTEPDNVFYINNVLVEKGFAVFPDQEQKNSLIDALSTPIVNLIHLFPTFVELEHGLAPSTLEMEVYYKCNTPINFCYPQYFTVDLVEEENIVKHATEFWEANILKGLRKMLHHHHNIDSDNIKDKPLNFFLFGKVEEEMREFVRNEEELGDNFCEEQSNHNETLDINSINKVEKWNDTVNELREDCRLSEDIMNDLLNIYDINAKTDSEQHNILRRDLHLSEEGNFGLKMSEYGDRESIYSNEEFKEYEGSCSKHPLQDLSFSRSNSSCNSTEYSDSDKYTCLLNDSTKSILSNEDRDELAVDDQVVTEERKIFNPNNPFLQDLDIERPKVDILGCGILAPSNPFLSYIPKEDNSDKSDSTDYGTYVQDSQGSQDSSTKVNNLESPCVDSDRLPESYHTASLNSVQFPVTSNSTIVTNSVHVEHSLRRDHSNMTPRSGLDISRPEFYPQNYFCPSPPFYNNYPPMYPQPFPYPAFNNPYYNNMAQQQFNRQVYMKSSYNVMQSHIPSTPIHKPIGPPPGFGPNPPRIDFHQGSSQYKDFYDSYNQVLKQKFNN